MLSDVRCPLALRNVEDLPHGHGIDLSHEAVRFSWHRLGPMFAAEIRRKRIGRMCAGASCRRHVDLAFDMIDAARHHPWRAVDHVRSGRPAARAATPAKPVPPPKPSA